MNKIITNISRGNNDYKFKPEHIEGLPAALKRLVKSINYNPATRELSLTDDDAQNLAVEIALASATQAGLMSAELFEKLVNIEEGAQVNPILGELATVDRGGDPSLFLNGNLEWIKPPNDNTTDLTEMENILPKTHGGTGNDKGTVDQLTNARNINGMSFNGTANVDFGGYCSTAAATAAKTVSISGYTLTNYSTVCVMFRYVNTASNPTLNVNDTGAFPIKLKNAATTKITSTAYQPVILQYYSSAWHIVDPNADNEITAASIGAAASSHTHSASDINSGTLPVARGGTGATSLANVSVGSATSASNDIMGNYIPTTYLKKTDIHSNLWTKQTAAINLNEFTASGFYCFNASIATNGPSDLIISPYRTFCFLICHNFYLSGYTGVMQVLCCSRDAQAAMDMYYRAALNGSTSTGIYLGWRKVTYTG